jgi:hypothetical protein
MIPPVTRVFVKHPEAGARTFALLSHPLQLMRWSLSFTPIENSEELFFKGGGGIWRESKILKPSCPPLFLMRSSLV